MDWESTGLVRRGNKLYIGRLRCEDLADEWDTPLYVMNEERIRDNIRRVRSAFERRYEKLRVHYACKANTSLAVLAIARQEGCFVDAVSPGEIFIALKAGFRPKQVLFTGNNVRSEELSFAVKTKVRITADSLSQIRRLGSIHQRAAPEIAIRINPEVGAGHHEHCITGGRDAKFGIWEGQARQAAALAKDLGMKVKGVHMHIGSGILTPEPFVPAIKRLVEIASEIQDETGEPFEFIDIGGGLGVPYRPQERELDLEAFSDAVVQAFVGSMRSNGIEGEPYLAIEPGRYIVADAGILLTRVNTVKRTPYKTFVGVDAGFNDLIRPAMYGSYHHILNASNIAAPHRRVDVAGPLCESGDLFARDREIAEPREGDVLAILTAGAYGYSMSSNYNSRPRAAEVLVRGGSVELIRERESLHDLVSGQSLPERLRD